MTATTTPAKVQYVLDAAARRGLTIEEREPDQFGTRTWVVTTPARYETRVVWVHWMPGRNGGAMRFHRYDRRTLKATKLTRADAFGVFESIAPYVDVSLGPAIAKVWQPDARYVPTTADPGTEVPTTADPGTEVETAADDDPTPDESATGVDRDGDRWSVARFGTVVVVSTPTGPDDIQLATEDEAIREFRDMVVAALGGHDDDEAAPCGVTYRTAGVDPYGTTCDLAPGHAGPHQGADPLGGDGTVTWRGGRVIGGDRTPTTDVRFGARDV